MYADFKRILVNWIGELKRKLQFRLDRFRAKALQGPIIITVHKGATVSQNKFPNQPNLVKGCVIKEIPYLSQSSNIDRGLGWDKRLFGPVTSSHSLTFEATPEYMVMPGVAERIKEQLPEVKLISILRDPIERAYSSWNMYRLIRQDPVAKANILRRHLPYLRGSQKETFLRVMNDPIMEDFEAEIEEELTMASFSDLTSGPTFVRSGIYVERLAPFWENFDSDHLMILESSMFKKDPRSHLEQICSFLNIPMHTWSEKDLRPHHVRAYDSPISGSTREKLASFFHPHNEALFKKVGQQYPWTIPAIS